MLREYPDDEVGFGKVAELTGLTLRDVRVTNRYYQEFRQEVDRWIDEVDQTAEEAAPRELRRIS